MLTYNDLSYKIIGAAYRVHKKLGPGLLESAYEVCFMYELKKLGFKVERQKPIPLIYDEIKLDAGYRIDLLVENMIIIEIKSIDAVAPVHIAQLLTYLKLSEMRLGLLINFNVINLKEGIKRVVNGL
jgi:GxxExxY protein